jgi:lipid-binding SYLF domain-containing protein
MKKSLFILCLALGSYLQAQVGGWNPEMEKDAENALASMIESTSRLQIFKDQAYGYAVFPKVTKAGIGIGGAAGKGVVYKGGELVGASKLKGATLGLQLGGQQYSEVIFFEDQEAFENFTNGNLKFDAQASAVALDEGASIDAAYNEGVAVFTQIIGGLMVEASIGGQHFTFDPVQ